MNHLQNKLFFQTIKTSESEIIGDIEKSIVNSSGKLITYFNQNSFNEFYSNSEFNNLIRSSFEVFVDGTGMKFMLRFLFKSNYQRFNATDLYSKLFKKFSGEKVPFYIIGGNCDPKIIEKLQNNILLAGYSNGYFPDTEIESVIEKIKLSGAKVIALGLGTPKQEMLAIRISQQLKNSVILCVGNFLNFYLGVTKRAPALLRSTGLEWLYRLYAEPGKLWKRYLIGIPLFIFRSVKYKFL
jgi:N-acetylglucosaminyldiphosphoundecaprenol N-acetyl-beta-D-mannosaminyltransferase